MRLIAQVLLAFLVAAGLGLGLTWAAVRHPPTFGAVRSGPWMWQPVDGPGEIDPYRLAAIATSGTLPLARGDGVVFAASDDDEGRPLDGRCFYRVAGPVPSAQAWTLTVQTPEGGVFANAAERVGFTSAEVLRDDAGHIAIETGPEARPGDWIPTAPRPFALMLRLYDTSVGGRGGELDGTLPTIRRIGCR
ncbi:MAG TPA: DUF1214 domain-containing protein [Hyphomicrobiales bacterium]|nr:DUF1214 domain-containing protein [Hyphomicrobiales bacterium]